MRYGRQGVPVWRPAPITLVFIAIPWIIGALLVIAIAKLTRG